MIIKTEDITHHSKRTQAENIEKAGTAYDVIMQREALSKSGEDYSPNANAGSDVPKTVTLESAITYFRSHASGDKSALYTMTADWLEKYRTASRTAINKMLAESKETAEDVLTVTMPKEVKE